MVITQRIGQSAGKISFHQKKIFPQRLNPKLFIIDLGQRGSGYLVCNQIILRYSLSHCENNEVRPSVYTEAWRLVSQCFSGNPKATFIIKLYLFAQSYTTKYNLTTWLNETLKSVGEISKRIIRVCY